MRIPREYEFEGDEVLLRREGGRLIIQMVPGRSRLLELLRGLEPIDDPFPDVDEGLPRLAGVRL